ncbi:MAG: molybdopterin molybdotransferase MoeA [Thermoplasmata archaeon]|nr:molybdopterin molybdotransferase MoeA [Thermoplasmata archaeon]
MKMRPFGALLPAPRALALLLAETTPVARTETLPLEEAVGRRSARRVKSRHAVPPFVRATWDGYAVVSRSTAGASSRAPVRLRLVGDVFAETRPGRTVRPQEAAAIATGGPLPMGADAVVIFEEVRVEGTEVVISAPVRRGDRIADVGEDFRRGTTLVEVDELLTPPRLGALAAAGEPTVVVWGRPRVGILPNGNELRAPGERLSPGTIHESNNASLGALARALGAEVTTHAPVPDDERAIEVVIRAAMRNSDLLLVTGGSSVGERDYLPTIFPRLGRLLFHGIAVRPGKPTLAVRTPSTLVIGMPGHPTSCLANGLWLVAPVLSRLAHGPSQPWGERAVALGAPYDVPTSNFSTVVPLELRDGVAWPTFRGSSAITSLVPANAFVLLPPGKPALRKGEVVVARLLPPPFAASVPSTGIATGRRKA